MKLSLLRDSPVTGIDGPLGQVADAVFDNLRWVVSGLWISVQEPARSYRFFVPMDRLVHARPQQRAFRASLWRDDLARRRPPRGSVPPAESGCSAAELVGCRLYAGDGACGRVSDILIDDHWVMGGLLIEAESGLRLPPALVPPADIDHIDLPARAIHTRRTRRQLARPVPA